MAWQDVISAWVGIDADRWRRLNNYFRQNIDEISFTLKLMEAGEIYFISAAANYDVDVYSRNQAKNSYVQVYQYETLWKPEGLTEATINIQAQCTINDPNAWLRIYLYHVNNTSAHYVDIPNIPVTVAWVSGQITGLPSDESYCSMSIETHNYTTAVQSYRAREMYLEPF